MRRPRAPRRHASCSPSPPSTASSGPTTSPAGSRAAATSTGSSRALVSITQASELGTVYTVDETRAIADAAHRLGMLLHVDGARLANAAAALGVSLAELTTEAGVDAVSFGGTKNGLVFGEAVVFCRPELGPRLPLHPQAARPARLEDALRLGAVRGAARRRPLARSARHANEMAARLAAAVEAIDGVEITHPVEANAVFARLPRAGDRPPARRAARRAPVLRLGRGSRRGPLDVRLGHAPRRRRRVRGDDRRRARALERGR